MNIVMALVLLVVQFLMGQGLLTLLNATLKPAMFFCLSVLLGVFVCSFVPFLLQLLYIPLTSVNVFVSLGAACLLLNVKFRWGINFREAKLNLKLYELPFILVIAFIMFVSIWRCFYLPPTPRDLLSGTEAIAEYAVREKTMINSVFSVNMEVTLTNQYKSPFITSLQVIYKYAGFPFGQIWLSNVFICFIVFLYHAVSRNLHRILAGSLILFFLAIPEMYAYTFMALFDYSNAVFFFLAAYFLFEFFRSGSGQHMALAGLLMGIATYIRSETLVLAMLLAPAVLWHHLKNRHRFARVFISNTYFLLPSAMFYVLTMYIYINLYLSGTYNTGSWTNQNPADLSPFFERLAHISSKLLFTAKGISNYGYFVFIFLFVLVTDLIYSRGMNKRAANWFYSVLVVYVGLALLGYLVPLHDLFNSTKRGLFKIFPLMLLYMSQTGLLTDISEKIREWELRRGANDQPREG